jgi:hypothetical protein
MLGFVLLTERPERLFGIRVTVCRLFCVRRACELLPIGDSAWGFEWSVRDS